MTEETSKIVLVGVDPAKFNVWASLLAELLQLTAAYVLSKLFVSLLSHYLRKGNTIPVNALGRIPGGLFDAFDIAKDMNWASPAVFILFLFLSDYSTMVAFFGLDFDLVPTKGSDEPILSLQWHERNPNFPYEAVGDPVNPHTKSKLELLFESGKDNIGNIDNHLELIRHDSIMTSFVAASDAIARGESVFLEQQAADETEDGTFLFVSQEPRNGTFTNSNDTTILYKENSFLTAINVYIPLNCDREMLEIQEERGVLSDFSTTSMVPNCDFTATRSSGIFEDIPEKRGGENKEEEEEEEEERGGQRAEVSAYVAFEASSAYLYYEGQPEGIIDDDFTFTMPLNALKLARDRVNFREGRSVYGFGGIKHGEVDIPFDFTAIASGGSTNDDYYSNYYFLVSKIQDEKCPDDPSQDTSSTCVAITTLTCEQLNTDNELLSTDDVKKDCILNQVEMVWVKNNVVDSKLVSMIAGVYGRNSKWATSLRKRRTLAIHSVPAALFMLGSVQSSPSIEAVKSATIDWVFIIFMSVPICLCVVAGLAYLCATSYKYNVVLPDDAPSLMVLGAESSGAGNSLRQKCNAFKDATPIDVEMFGDVARLKVAPEQTTRTSAYCNSNKSVNALDEKATGIRTPEISGDGPKSRGKNEPGRNMKARMGGQIVDDDEAPPELYGEEEIDNASNKDKEHHDRFLSLPAIRPSRRPSDGLVESQLPTKTASVSSLSNPTLDPALRNMDSSGALDEEAPDEETTTGLALGNKDMGTSNIEASGKKKKEKIMFQKGKQSKYTPGAIPVLICMIICIATWIGGVVYIHAKASPQHDAINTVHDARSANPGIPTAADPIFKNDYKCFTDGYELGKTMYVYFEGDAEYQKDVNDTYGEVGDWCVDYVKDFSFLFANRRRSSFGGDLSKWNVSNGIDFSWMFFDFAWDEHNRGEELSGWNLMNAKDLTGMFAVTNGFGGYSFNGSIDSWDVSSCTSFRSMFYEASSFNQNLSSWDVSNGIDFNHMFYYAGSFNQNLSSWDVSNGNDFSYMFSGAYSFNQNLSSWDVSNGIDFSWMFSYASSFNQDLSSWDVSNGIDFSVMFGSADSFNQDLSSWDVSNGIDFSVMFGSASSFNQDLSSWDVSNGNDFSYMFLSADSFNQDLSSWDVSNGIDFSYMFSYAYSFNQNLCSWNERLNENAGKSGMFEFTGCLVVEDASEFAVCQYCEEYPSASPSMYMSLMPTVSSSAVPTGSPSMSLMPSSVFCPEYNEFKLNLTLDDYGDETSWNIVDAQDSIIFEGDGYPSGQRGENYVESGCLSAGSYTLNFYDSEGDGLWTPGYYELTVGGIVVASLDRDEFIDIQSTTFVVLDGDGNPPTDAPSLIQI